MWKELKLCFAFPVSGLNSVHRVRSVPNIDPATGPELDPVTRFCFNFYSIMNLFYAFAKLHGIYRLDVKRVCSATRAQVKREDVLQLLC